MPRIKGLNKSEMSPETLAVCDRLEQRYGSVPYNHSVLARRPTIFSGFRAMWDGLERSGLLPPRLADLLNVKVASLIGCGL